METITLQGPVVILPTEAYQTLLNRLTHLENMVNQMTQLMEDSQDIKIMREAEAEYHTGDAVDFATLLTEIQAENE